MTKTLMRYVLIPMTLIGVSLSASGTAQDPVAAIVARYVEAAGGAAALSAVTTRVTRGQFDNGRGLRAPYASYQKPPAKMATVIGSEAIDSDSGSGRGSDGKVGWDKNFIGTGLRTLEGGELAEVMRSADLFPAARLRETCRAVAVEQSKETDVIRCELPGRVDRWHFDRKSGLAVRNESAPEGRPAVVVHFEDYRRVDAALVPFRTRIVIGNLTITYAATTVQHNAAIEDRVFAMPAR